MKEIKFRAWDKLNKKFYSNITSIHFDSAIHGITAISNLGDEKYISTENISIDQYTGINDKNGKSIYSDDFVRINNEIFHIQIDLLASWAVSKKHQFLLFEVYESDIEIIGNIYQNNEYNTIYTDELIQGPVSIPNDLKIGE